LIRPGRFGGLGAGGATSTNDTSDDANAARFARSPWLAHHANVRAFHPLRPANAAADSPLARHASTRRSHSCHFARFVVITR
jgi:hypothetical protein